MKITGWLHVATMPGYQPILDEILGSIESSGILSATDKFYACVAGEAPVLPDWLTLYDQWDSWEEGENPTMRRLWNWSKTRNDDCVVYLHTKGVSHPLDDPYLNAWRRYMLKYVIRGWRDCVAALVDHDLCGVDWTLPEEFGRVWDAPDQDKKCFCGNFWWSRLDWLAGLPEDQVILDVCRWNAEFNFVTVGNPRVMEFAHSGINLYREFPGPEFGL